MINGHKICVVLPAYNAAGTLRKVYEEIPREIVDRILLVDDNSHDETVAIARRLGIEVLVHSRNLGYGGNQKTCYLAALESGADIVVMVHPDYQYHPALVTAMASMVVSGLYDVVLASRILGRGAIEGGMPRYKYISNRFLTLAQNVMIGQKLSEYHTGYRAFSRRVLEQLPLVENSNDFVFDNQMLVQAHYFGFHIGEISCPTHYSEDASSINFQRSVVYGLGCLATGLKYRLEKLGVAHFPIFKQDGKRLLGGAWSGHIAADAGVEAESGEGNSSVMR